MKPGKSIPLAVLALVGLGWSCRPAQTVRREAALRDLEKKVEETLPAVVALTGIAADRPVKVDVMTKDAFGEFFARTLEDEYPDGALDETGAMLRRGRPAAPGIRPCGRVAGAAPGTGRRGL